jgi:Derlin-2/3
MSQLEKLQYKKPAEFLTMLLFGVFSLLIGNTFFKLPPRTLGHNLSCFLVYVWSRTFEGGHVNFMEFFELQVELLPWFFAAQTYVLEGEVPYSDFMGIAIGHLYFVLKQRGIMKTPQFLQDQFQRPSVMKQYEKVAVDFE